MPKKKKSTSRRWSPPRKHFERKFMCPACSPSEPELRDEWDPRMTTEFKLMSAKRMKVVFTCQEPGCGWIEIHELQR